MANDATGNPWVLDTAGSIYTHDLTIKKMEWHPNAAADSLEVRHDKTQKVIWKRTALTGGTAGIETWDAPNGEFHAQGFDLESVGTSCTLYVWIK